MLALLEPKTLGLVVAILLMTIAGLMAFFLATRKTYSGFSFWTGAFAVFAGSIVLLILRDFIPASASILAGNYLLMLGMALLYDGLTLFHGKRLRWSTNGALHLGALLCVPLLAWFLYVEPDINMRIVCASTFRFVAALACLSSIVLEKRSPTNELLGAICFLWAAMALMRILFALTATPIVHFLQEDTTLRAVLLVDGMLTLVSAFCLLVLTQTRVEEELKEARSDADRASRTDSLTGLWNRYHFEGEARREIERARRYGQACSLLMFDIDHFKQVNDSFGHLVGDQVLKGLATLATDTLRGSDLLCRWGGEEFVVIVPAGPEAAAAAAEKLRLRIAETPFAPVGIVTVSVGVAPLRASDDLASWTLRADHALYRAKAMGRNRVEREDGPPARVSPVTLHWNPAFSSGDPVIDGQHKELFEKANLLLEKCSAEDVAGARGMLREILQEIEHHFGYEESMLAQIGFQDVDRHRREHERLRERGRRLLGALEERKDGAALLADLTNFVVRELALGHIGDEDMQYVEMMRKQHAA